MVPKSTLALKNIPEARICNLMKSTSEPIANMKKAIRALLMLENSVTIPAHEP